MKNQIVCPKSEIIMIPLRPKKEYVTSSGDSTEDIILYDRLYAPELPPSGSKICLGNGGKTRTKKYVSFCQNIVVVKPNIEKQLLKGKTSKRRCYSRIIVIIRCFRGSSSLSPRL